MRFSNTLRLSISSLTNHPFRAFLAGLGVVFGVGAVVGMLAIGEGARIESIRQIQEMGVDKIIVRSLVEKKGEETNQSGVVGIKEQDIRHIESQFENVKAVLPINHWTGIATSQWVELPNIHALGVPLEFLQITNSHLVGSRSRFITEKDNDEGAPVCVIGSRLARQLFQFREPIGERILVNATYFTIVGVLNNAGDRDIKGVGSINSMIYLPSATGFNHWSDPTSKGKSMPYKLLYVVVDNIEHIENTSRRLEAYLSAVHTENDYEIILPFELMRQQEATQRIFTIVMASIASISLLVGGIGIMNIMLANIYERMKEIGTRRALGATRQDILIQFLVESVVLTTIGGALGAMLGVLLAGFVAQYAEMPTAVTLFSVIVSLSVSVLTGVVFGSFPAWKAANLSPMEALRHE
ncbi:MAG: ABC transporter permease [Opitutaceae bacterium]